jgi:predicted MFS family arabinose efflux permease
MNKTELEAGWPALLGATLAFIGGVVCLPYYTAGLFITPLQTEFGWSRGALSYGPAVLIMGFVLSSPFIGIIAERIDPRRLVPVGMIVVAVAFASLSQMQGGILRYYLTLAMMAVFGNLSGACVLTPILARTFFVSRGAAIGIAMAGTGVGSAIGGPLVAAVISSAGWRSGYLAMAGFVLLMTPIVWLSFRRGGPRLVAGQDHTADGISFGHAVRQPLFWLLWLAFFQIALASTGLIIHFVPLLIDEGTDPRVAAGIASGIGASVVVGRLFTGFMVDRMFAPHVAAMIMAVGGMGYVSFMLGGAPFAVAAALAIGISFGAETDLVGYMTARYFGLRHYGRIFGLLYGLCTVGNAISPVLYGTIRDRMGTYRPTITVAACLLAASAFIFVALLPQYPKWAKEVRSTEPSAEPALPTP